MNNLGLRVEDIAQLISVLNGFPQIEEAVVFGSRAKGNFRNGSDVDIALKGVGLTFSVVAEVSYSLNEETNLPYMFDVLNYTSIQNTELVSHIDRVGVCIYHRE